MKKFILKTASYLLVAVLASVGTLAASQFLGGNKLAVIQKLLDQCFIGEIDHKALQDAAATAMVDALEDRWSHYQTAEEYKAYRDYTTNTYVGIGITIRSREDGQGLDVIQVEADGPADQAGVRAGDRLVAVDGQSILGMTVTQVGDLIQVEEGTAIELELLRQEQKLSLSVITRRLKSPVAQGQLLEDGMGLVRIVNFDDRCASETIAVIEDLISQGAKALIFDVRNNPGGYQRELVKLLDYLLPEGPIFRSQDYRGIEQVEQSDADCLEIPMAVLVNLHSYSAAEFFAAALEEYDVAVLVGEKTYGKGYFQNTFELGDGSAVTLSIGKYFTPQGKSLAGVGLTPEVEVPVDEQTAAAIYTGALEPNEDPQLQAAIQALTSL